VSQSGLMDHLHSSKTTTLQLHCGEPQDQDYVECFCNFTWKGFYWWNRWFCQTLCVDSCKDQESHCEWCTIICAGLQCTWIEGWGLQDVSCRHHWCFSDASAIEGILSVHHFHVTNSATVVYAFNKDVSGTRSDEALGCMMKPVT